MIAREERVGTRHARRRWLMCGSFDVTPYSRDHLNVSHWIKGKFLEYSPVTALFLTHALINNNVPIINRYLSGSDLGYMSFKNSNALVPITLNHFRLLARLGRVPPYQLFVAIEWGAEFYRSEEDYYKERSTGSPSIKVEHTSPPPSSMNARCKSASLVASQLHEKYTTSISKDAGANSSMNKRPRRAAASTVSSYVVPNSDDEMIVDRSLPSPLSSDCEDWDSDRDPRMASGKVEHKPKEMGKEMKELKVKRELAVKMQTWVKELSCLQKEEGRKLKQKKKQVEMDAPEGTKIRVPKSEFYKNLNTNLRHLRKLADQRWIDAFGHGPSHGDDYTDEEDDYVKPRATKRRKTGKEPAHR
jgi:hypothetical protein